MVHGDFEPVDETALQRHARAIQLASLGSQALAATAVDSL
jgi:hypothetical protein